MAEWTFITNHGLVLAHISRRPQTTAREIASAIDITERTVHKIIAELEVGGYVRKKRLGRNNVYVVNPDLKLRHQTVREVPVGELLRALGSELPAGIVPGQAG